MNRVSEEKNSRSAIENRPTQPTNDRILVVDDDEVCGESISSMLTAGGYKCRTASDELDALAVLNSGEEFGLLVANLRMPKLDGIGLLTRTKEQFPDMSVVVVVERSVFDISEARHTAFARAAIRERAYRCLVKPVERVNLLIAVRCALRYSHPRLENPLDIECTNCHVRKGQIDAWRVKYGSFRFVCCEDNEDLLLRSLPSGEDR